MSKRERKTESLRASSRASVTATSTQLVLIDSGPKLPDANAVMERLAGKATTAEKQKKYDLLKAEVREYLLNITDLNQLKQIQLFTIEASGETQKELLNRLTADMKDNGIKIAYSFNADDSKYRYKYVFITFQLVAPTRAPPISSDETALQLVNRATKAQQGKVMSKIMRLLTL